jgi:hypothetical protein
MLQRQRREKPQRDAAHWRATQIASAHKKSSSHTIMEEEPR